MSYFLDIKQNLRVCLIELENDWKPKLEVGKLDEWVGEVF